MKQRDNVFNFFWNDFEILSKEDSFDFLDIIGDEGNYKELTYTMDSVVAVFPVKGSGFEYAIIGKFEDTDDVETWVVKHFKDMNIFTLIENFRFLN